MACHIICFVSFRFVLFRFVSICFVSFRSVPFRFDLFRFVSICFVSFCFVSVSFRTLQGPYNVDKVKTQLYQMYKATNYALFIHITIEFGQMRKWRLLCKVKISWQGDYQNCTNWTLLSLHPNLSYHVVLACVAAAADFTSIKRMKANTIPV